MLLAPHVYLARDEILLGHRRAPSEPRGSLPGRPISSGGAPPPGAAGPQDESHRLHVERDRAAPNAHDSPDIKGPPCCPLSDEDETQPARHEDKLGGRLSAGARPTSDVS